MLAPGTVLQNRYRIIRLLGTGGMGAVYLAQSLNLEKLVAVKENTTGDRRQFHQEAVILANLRHPNLPQVIDRFCETKGAQYLVMEYVQGDDLETLQRALTMAGKVVGMRRANKRVSTNGQH